MIVKHVYTASTRPCTRAVNTAMYTCTHYTTVYEARTRPQPVYTCERPCYVLHDRVHGRIRAVYTTVYTAHTRVQSRVHGSVYTTWPCTRAVSTAISGHSPCTRPCGVHTAVYTCRIHGRIRAMYMVVFTAMYGPCTRWPCKPPCTRPVHMVGGVVQR